MINPNKITDMTTDLTADKRSRIDLNHAQASGVPRVATVTLTRRTVAITAVISNSSSSMMRTIHSRFHPISISNLSSMSQVERRMTTCGE